MWATQARSAETRRRVSESSAKATSSSSPCLTWSATAPCPASGTSSSTAKRWPISLARPSRSRPAAARTTASSPRSPRLRRRVSTFPRKGSMDTLGSRARSCAFLRADAVPIRIPGRSSSAPQSASRASSRARKAPIARPSVAVDVMSFAEWIATSTRPSSKASSISLTKTPRAPISPNGFERSRSPVVVIGTRATSSSGFACRRASAASSAWVRASLLPRLPSRTSTSPSWSARVFVLEREEVADRVRVENAVGRGGCLFHPDRRQVEQLVDDLRRERFDCPPLARGQRPQPPLGTGELVFADRFSQRAERRDCRHDVEGELPVAEPVCFVRDDRFCANGLRPPPGHTLLHDSLEVVDVVQVAPFDLVHGRVDVARHRDVHEEDGASLARPHRPLHLLGGEDVTAGACGGYDDVGVLELRLDGVQTGRAAPEATGETLRPLDGTIRDEDAVDAARDEIDGGQVAHLPRAQDEDPPTFESPEDPLGKLGCSGGDGGRVLADRGLRAYPPTDPERLAEEPVEDGPCGACLARGLVGSAHLAEDLRLPGDQRIEAGGYAENMQSCRLVRERVESRGDLALREAGQSGQLCECTGLCRLFVAVREIELCAVARGEDHRFGVGARQSLHQLSVLGCAHEELLAQLDRRAVVGGADEDESHLPRNATRGRGRPRRRRFRPVRGRRFADRATRPHSAGTRSRRRRPTPRARRPSAHRSRRLRARDGRRRRRARG